jgi:hypothetical protein
MAIDLVLRTGASTQAHHYLKTAAWTLDPQQLQIAIIMATPLMVTPGEELHPMDVSPPPTLKAPDSLKAGITRQRCAQRKCKGAP